MPTLALNRKARFDYECLEKIEAGLVLTGQEVKSVREGGAKIDTGHIIAHQGNLFMIGANIAPYKKASSHLEHDPARSRQLLIHKKQLLYLLGKIGEKGLTLIPISLYTRGNRIKLEFWLARGKKAHEKRQKIKDRDIQRETDRYIRDQD